MVYNFVDNSKWIQGVYLSVQKLSSLKEQGFFQTWLAVLITWFGKLYFMSLPLQEISNLRQSVRCYLNQNEIWGFFLVFVRWTKERLCNECLSLQHSPFTLPFSQWKSWKHSYMYWNNCTEQLYWTIFLLTTVS